MLSISAMSGGQAGYYLGLAREDYYLEGGEPPGKWFGEGAERLGLVGEVEPDHLYNLFAGLAPSGEYSLVQKQQHDGKADHRPGWDLTFSAPKSVSTLWSQSEEGERLVIQKIHAKAVTDALAYLQDTASVTRRGKGGKDLEKVGLVVAMFEHSTSRAMDPQLHTHALVMNLSIRDDYTTGTLSSLDLFLSKMAAGALYRAELAKGLEEHLGLRVHRERSWFEVDGVSEDLMQTFSKRRDAIEEALSKSGLSSAEASAVAAIQTRDSKSAVSRSELFQDWRLEGARHGWSTEQTRKLFDAFHPSRDIQMEILQCCQKAAGRLTKDEAFFSERDFIRYVAEEAQGRGLGASEVREGSGDFLAHSAQIIRLGSYKGEDRFTTQQMLDLEHELLAGADTLKDNDAHELSSESAMRTLSRYGELSQEQLQAVWHITNETGALAVVSGMAGTGKTRMLFAAREAWESEGYNVIGGALAARAATELTSGAQIESGTIAKILLDIDRGGRRLTAKTILVIDEAGMVATPEMRRLILACQESGAKLVLIGDERQLQPIGPGAPFMELGARFGRAELTDVRRQNEDWARQAVKDMADGKARDALKAFAERGLINISETRSEAMLNLVRSWRQDGLRPEQTLILAGTRKDVQTLNRHAQDERLKAGELGADPLRRGSDLFYLNDRVMFTANKRTLGVQNGSKGTVCGLSVEGGRMSVKLDSGHKITIQTDSFPHIQLGYAATTHKAQGATTNKAYVLGGGPMQARELSYVQASRAKLETEFFATKAETGDDIAKLAKEMERSRRKEMVLTLEREGINR